MNNYTDEVREDINALAENARALVVATGNMAGEQVQAARQRLSAALEGAQEICGRVRQKAIGKAKATDRVVRDHPYQTVGIALGIGALIGFLLTRSKNGTSTADKCEKNN